MRAYVQRCEMSDGPYVGWETLAHGFWERGYEVIRFDYPDLDDGKLDRGLIEFPEETVVSGGVRTIREAIQRAGRPLPDLIDLPNSLQDWIRRDVWTARLGDIRSEVQNGVIARPVHVKPLEHHKLFKGQVIRQFSDLIPVAAFDNSTPILVQDVIEFVSEWRASVLRGKVVNVSHYLGDPLLFPDSRQIQSALTAFEDQPIAFGMDWGVTDAGETCLVEVNDGFALGNYGVRSHLYTAMVETRWRQLMGLRDNGVGERLL